MVVPPLMMPGMASTGAGMVATYVEVLGELDQHIRAQHAGAQKYIDSEDARPASMKTALAQLQREMGLLRTLQGIFCKAAQQRLVAEQPGGSSCALGHGPECPATTAARASVRSATEASGAGPPCRSCLLAHAQLLAACSTLLRFWPECVLGKERAAWAWAEAASECALHMLQDVSTAVLQHQQPHADGLGGLLQQRQAAPPADVLQAGLAALELLEAVCCAAASPHHAVVCRRNMVPTLCDRDMLDSSCMLPSMLAVGAAAVLGQEMQRRLCRTAATCADSGTGSAAAGAICGSSGGVDAADAAVPKNHARQHGTAAACSHSMQGSSKGAAASAVGLGAADAVWRLVRVTEQWAGGQLLPQPFTLLLDTLGCDPKAFLLLACIWQHQQQGSSGSHQQQASSGSQQRQREQRSTDQIHHNVLSRLWQAYQNTFYLEHRYIVHYSFPEASHTLLQRLSDCHARGLHQHTKQHLLLAVLLMRDAIRGSFRGMFEPGLVTDTAAQLSEHPMKAASFAAGCVSTWLCWEQFNRQQLQETEQEEPAAVSGAATAPSQHTAHGQPWALGGASSSAVLLEVLQGHCRLLREGVRELHAETSSLAAARSSGEHSSSSSGEHSSSSSGVSSTEEEWCPGFHVSYVDNRVMALLNSVRELLRAVVAAAAVDSGVLQQAAPHLFGLAGTLEQLVRLRHACHRDRLVMRTDLGMLQLLQLMLGSLDLSAYAELRAGGPARQPSAPAAAPRAQRLVKACGLLPFAAVFVPPSSKQQRQLLGLLFSSLKLFSTYPAGLYAVSFALDHQDNWMAAACDTIRAVCAAGRLLLVAGGSGGWDAQAQQQHKGRTPQGVAGEQSGSAPATPYHSCGLGADGMAALLPWVVLQGRALQLWVALFRVYVQLPPAAEASKMARSSKAQEAIWVQPHNLVGSAEALNLLAVVFEEAVAPSTQLLAVVLQGAAYRCEQQLQRQSLSNSALVSGLQATLKQAMATGRLLYCVPSCLWPPTSLKKVAEGGWLQQQLAKHGQQLRGHCREQGLDLSHLEPASGVAAATVLQVLQTLVATSEGLKQLGDSAQTQYRLRQSDVRRYLKSWEVGDAAALKGVLAMLSGGEHSAAGVAVAAWLCSPSIAGDLLAQLQEFSSQLSTLPIHEACNNPACRVTAGSREQGLVSGKACVCAGCRMGHYCSRACQREHWPLHQLQCSAATVAHDGNQ